MELDADVEKFRMRFLQHVDPSSPDDSLCVLKGHLISEEIVSDYIRFKLSHPEHISFEGSTWKYINKLELAASLSSDQNHDKWVWSSLKKLNKIRNNMSHSLEPKNLSRDRDDFFKSVKPHLPERYKGVELNMYSAVLFSVSGLFVVYQSERSLLA